jgi:allantoate deiminase
MLSRGSFEIDPVEIERELLELGAIGAHSGTGVWRTVYSPDWVAANDLVARWAGEAGLTVSRDAVGNLWMKFSGSEPGKSIVSGSHIDTQKPGGRYDGALGVLAALTALRVLKRHFGQPRQTLEALSLCEEEGSRFPTVGFWGSRAITGRSTPADADEVRDHDGVTIAAAMREVGLDPARIADARRTDIAAFLELHIEQGPVLEHAGLAVGVVDAITGIRHTEVTLNGVQNHAGAFPMDLRADPMAGFAEIASGLIDTAHRMGRPAVTTIGRCIPYPNAPAVIPRSVTFTIDHRHPDPAKRQTMYQIHDDLMREIAARRGLRLSMRVLFDHEPCLSDPALVATLKQAAAAQGVASMVMASGAGHDTQRMASIAPVAMIFVRSKDGRSHTPEEFSSIEDIVEGVRVLTAALHELAY